MTSQALYWALHLDDRDRGEHVPPGANYSVQKLGNDGAPTLDILYLKGTEESVELCGVSLPEQKLAKVKLLPEGAGEYFDELGGIVEPF